MTLFLCKVRRRTEGQYHQRSNYSGFQGGRRDLRLNRCCARRFCSRRRSAAAASAFALAEVESCGDVGKPQDVHSILKAINLCGILLRNQSIYGLLRLVAGRGSNTLLLTFVVELGPQGNMLSEVVGHTYVTYFYIQRDAWLVKDLTRSTGALLGNNLRTRRSYYHDEDEDAPFMSAVDPYFVITAYVLRKTLLSTSNKMPRKSSPCSTPLTNATLKNKRRQF